MIQNPRENGFWCPPAWTLSLHVKISTVPSSHQERLVFHQLTFSSTQWAVGVKRAFMLKSLSFPNDSLLEEHIRMTSKTCSRGHMIFGVALTCYQLFLRQTSSCSNPLRFVDTRYFHHVSVMEKKAQEQQTVCISELLCRFSLGKGRKKSLGQRGVINLSSARVT